VFIKERRADDSFMCQRAPHLHWKTIRLSLHVLNVLWEALSPKWHKYADSQVQRYKILPHQWRQYGFKKSFCSKICAHMCAVTAMEAAYHAL
jgi:hypothetical protein